MKTPTEVKSKVNLVNVKSSYIYQDELGKVLSILDKENKLLFIEFN